MLTRFFSKRSIAAERALFEQSEKCCLGRTNLSNNERTTVLSVVGPVDSISSPSVEIVPVLLVSTIEIDTSLLDVSVDLSLCSVESPDLHCEVC